MLSKFFIERPIFASVIAIITVIAGGVALMALPIARYPEISPPTVMVTAFYPGANAQVVSETVAAPIEQEVNGVEGMLYMSSSSSSDGAYSLTVTFEIGTDTDMATVLVQNRVAIATAKLPEDVRRQGVTTKKQSTNILQFVTLNGDAKRGYDGLYLSNYATIRIKDELSRIEGVGSVTVFGAADYSMRVWMDPSRLKARNMTTEDVVQAIQEQNVQVAAGQIGQRPAPSGQNFQYTVNTLGRLRDVEQFEDLIVKTDGARITRVKDVARVELGAKDYDRDSRFNGQECTTLAIYQLPGANALEVATKIRSKLDELSRAFPEGISYAIPFDTTLFVKASIQEVYTTLFQAVGLVFITIFIFLQDWRATLIPAVAIPVSLIGTFAVMAGIGFSINMLTLFGIVLAIGIVVDDAIVVVENTVRHIDETGLPPRDAAIRAMAEVTGPVVATTLVLLAVFVPTAFLGGITGQLYRQFALTISAATVFSTINALTLSPALAGILLRKSPERRNFFFRGFNTAFDHTTNAYQFVITGMVRRVALVMLLFGGMLVLTGWGFGKLPTGFLPGEDQGYLFVSMQLPDAAAVERTDDVTRQAEAVIENTPGVDNSISIVGYSLLTGTNGSNLSTLIVVLEPWEDRTDASTQLDAVLAHITRELWEIDEAVAFAFVPPPIDGLGVAGGFQMQVQDRGDVGLNELSSLTNEMIADGSAQSGLTAMNTTFRANVPQLFADIDREKVKAVGVPLSSVFNTLQAALGSTYVNDFNKFGRTYQVRVQADQQYRASADDIRNLDVRNAQGDMVPIGTFVDVQETFGPQVIKRYNLYPTAEINGSPAPGHSSGQAMALMEQMADAKLPTTMGYEWTGMSYQEKHVGSEQFVIFGLAVVLVFLVLAAQYESWTSPAAVILVVPLAALGVVIAVMLRGSDNNVYTQIGVVLLVALASKNAILIVEFSREQRQAGVGLLESAVSAARLRFRAILMTSFSSVLGFLPLLLASGAGAGSRQAVGTSVVGGMIAATAFSLMFVPSFFVVFQGLDEWTSKIRGATSSGPLVEKQPPAPEVAEPAVDEEPGEHAADDSNDKEPRD